MLYLVSYSHQQKTARLRTGVVTRRPLSTSTERKVVGEEGFEPPTSCSQSRRATRLRYTPKRRETPPRGGSLPTLTILGNAKGNAFV